MADENLKLAKFQSAVFAEVDLKALQIKNEAEHYKQNQLEINEDNCLENAYNLIQKQNQLIKKQNQRKIAKSTIEAKHSLLIKRNDITDTIFKNIKTRLVDFTKTSDYSSYLIKTIEAFSTKNKIENVEIILRKDDINLQNEIKKAYSLNCEIIESNDIKIGGFIIQNKPNRIYFDETLDQKLADEKTNFINTSKFSL